MPSSGGLQTYPLSKAEIVDVRRFCGYGVGSGAALQSLDVQMQSTNLTLILAAITGDEAAVVRTIYIAQLVQLESDVIAARSDIDTNKAAVWERNPAELVEKEQLFTAWRWRLCYFLSAEPGPGIRQMIVSVAGSGTSGSGGGTMSSAVGGIYPGVLVV